MLQLYPRNQIDFSWNGEPIRHSYDEHVVRDEGWLLTFKVLLDEDEDYKKIKKGMVVKAWTLDGEQAFRVWDITKGHGFLAVEALHLIYDLDTKLTNPIYVNNGGLNGALQQFKQGLPSEMGPFLFSTGVTKLRTYNTEDADRANDKYNAMDVFMDGAHSIVGTWEVELLINNWDVRLVESVGTRTGALLYEKKNIAEFEDEATNKNLITRIYAQSTFRPERGEDDTEEPEEVHLSVVVDSPLMGAYEQVHEAIYINNDLRTTEELRQFAQRKFTYEHVDLPTRNIKVSTNIIDGTEIKFGDYLVLKYLTHDVDEEIRCVGYDVNPVTQDIYEIELGSRSGSMAGSIKGTVQDLTESQLSNEMAKIAERVTRIVVSANGYNRTAYGPEPVPNPIEGDIWYEYQFDTPDTVTMKIWQDGIWVIVIDDFLQERIREEFEKIEQDFADAEEKFDENTQRTEAIFNEWEELKNSETWANQNMFLNIVGNDGKWVYSNNRLHVEGQQTSDVSSNEVILTLEEGEKVLTHNGEGFSVGNDYTFSYANPTFVERPNSAVTVNFEPIPMHETVIGITPKHPQYPISARRVTSNNNLFNKIYHDDYTVTASSDWYQLAYKNVKIDKNQTVILPLIYKDGELTIEHNDVEISIEGVQLDGWRTQTRIEYVPFIREIVNDNSIYPEESYISQNGVTGQITYEYQAEYVQGQFTGNIKDEKVIARIDPINEIFVQGTKTDTVPTSVVKFEFRDNSNLNVVHMGDSIIMGYGRQVKVPEVVEKTLQANSVINAGFGGTMANLHPNIEFAKISFVNLADSIASGNFSLQENMNLPGLNSAQRTAYMETAYRLRDVDWYETDALILSYGVNDWTDGTPIGTVSTKDKETYLGALKYGIDVIKAKYPHLQILLTQPIYWSDPSAGETIHTRTNSKGNKLTEFINALPQLGYPIAQTYDELGINDNNKSQYFDAHDGVHPNDNGNILLGTKIGRDFNQLITVGERPEKPVEPTEIATVNFEFT